MRLNFAKLSEPMQKTVGHGGMGGTDSIDGALSRPTIEHERGDTVGPIPVPLADAESERLEMSHLSLYWENKVGRCNPSIYAVVPLVPPVPPEKHINEIEHESPEQRESKSCCTCDHAARPGKGNLYCAGRDDLRLAYGANHPLRRLPEDGGAECETWRDAMRPRCTNDRS